MFIVSYTGCNHCNAVFVARFNNFFEFIVECGTRNMSITKSCDDFFVAVRERKKRETKESNQRKIRDKKEREITQNNFVVYRFNFIEKKLLKITLLFIV